jgi:hypothetical protein
MQWHGLQGDDYVMKDRASRLWFENTTKHAVPQRYDTNANFAAQNYNNWQSLGAFGNATMYVDKFDARWAGGGRGLRYKSVPFGETYYGENHQGKVDRMIRWFRLTAYQAVQKFGIDWLPETLHGAAAAGQPDHLQFPALRAAARGRLRSGSARPARMPFSSLLHVDRGQCLMAPEGGYHKFPYSVSRYDQTPGEVYGRGPAMLVLPSLKTLNAEKITFLKQGHRAADPVLLMADDGIVGMDMRPGAQNKGGVTSDGKPLVHTLPTGDIQISRRDDAGGARHHRRRVPGVAVQGAVRAPEHDRDAGDRARQREGHAGGADARPSAHRICRRAGRARARSARRHAHAGSDAAAAARGLWAPTR